MRRSMLAVAYIALLALLALSTSCTIEKEAPNETNPDIVTDAAQEVPDIALSAAGLTVDGTLLVAGAERGTIESLLGPAEMVRDLGSAGKVLCYPSLGLEVIVETATWQLMGVDLFADFVGTNQWDLTLGSPFGTDGSDAIDAIADPFGLGFHLPDLGVRIGLSNGYISVISWTGQ